MGGDISVESVLNKGTRFSFSIEFPLLPSCGAELGARSNLDSDTKALANSPMTLAPLRILVADDNQTNREILKLMLERDGHQVFLANDGAEALRQLTSTDFDLALLDHNMPNLTGLDAVRMYRSASASPIPVIIASADATPDAVNASYAAGAAAHLCKPVTLEQLRSEISNYAPQGRYIHRVTKRSDAPAPRLVASEETVQLIDKGVLAQRAQLSPNPKFAEDLVEGYIRDAELLAEEIHVAVDIRDLARLRDAAHALKGGSATIGANGLYEFSKRLQTMDDETLASDTLPVLIELNDLVRRTTEALRSFIATRRMGEKALAN